MAFQTLAAGSNPHWLTVVLAIIEALKLIALAYIGAQAAASARERNRRRSEEDAKREETPAA